MRSITSLWQQLHVPQGTLSSKKTKFVWQTNVVFFVVDLKGFEPSTSRMRTERSPN